MTLNKNVSQTELKAIEQRRVFKLDIKTVQRRAGLYTEWRTTPVLVKTHLKHFPI